MRWLDEVERRAPDALSPALAAYFGRGAAGGRTLREQTPAWDALRLRPHILRDVSAVETSTTVLGTPVATPVLIAPTALQVRAHPDGEEATARAAVQAGSLLAVTSNTGVSFEAIAATGAPWWVQPYVTRDRSITAALVSAAVRSGARAIVLTADTPLVGRNDAGRDRVWDEVADHEVMVNVDVGKLGLPLSERSQHKAADLTVDSIGWLRELSGLPVVVKGVLRGDDAVQCAHAGAAAVIVSAHGGRQLDGAVPTARALPEVAEALAGTGVEVYVDGGLRRGEHVLSALALGARAVFVGRPALWALAVAGADGVARMLRELTTELRETMALCGASEIAAVTRDLVAAP